MASTDQSRPPPFLREAMRRRLPVTLVGGFVGAGKTSVINQLLLERAPRQVAVISNDLEELAVDRPWQRRARAQLDPRAPEVIALSDRCLSTAPADTLASVLTRVSLDPSIDSVIVELCGTAEPAAIASMFSPECEAAGTLLEVAELQAVVSVIDAQAFLGDYAREPRLAAHGLEPTGHRLVPCLLAHQVECADVLVVAKVDRVSSEELELLEAALHHMNPVAHMVRHPCGDIQVLAQQRAGQVLGTFPTPASQHGISSFVYQARRPFHPARLRAWLQSEWPGVLRSRGVFWLATRMDEVGAWSQAGGGWEVKRAGYWWATMPRDVWSGAPELCAAIEARWQDPFGDRRQELRLIGYGMNERQLRASFDECLLSDAEFASGPRAWSELHDPFARWSDLTPWKVSGMGPSALH